MKNLAKPVKAYLIKIFSDLHNAVVGAIVATVILSGGGIYIFAQNLWLRLKSTVLSPTPLWVTLFSVLLLLIYIRFTQFQAITAEKNQLLASSPNEPEKNQKPKVKLSEVHEKVLELVFEKSITTEYCRKTLELSREEANYYLHDLSNKNMINSPAPYAPQEEWSIRQVGREYVMAHRDSEKNAKDAWNAHT